jgi:hypothetical protein
MWASSILSLHPYIAEQEYLYGYYVCVPYTTADTVSFFVYGLSKYTKLAPIRLKL